MAAVAAFVGLAVPAAASAHLERPSYWPDPRPDTSVTPAAGGKVPEIRSLASAVTGAGPGKVRVVCQDDSLKLLRAAVGKARKVGVKIRPSQPATPMSKKQARRLIKINTTLKRRCKFKSIQAAVTASGNNDRVVIMPGRYTEPESRKAPVNDPRCNPSLLQNDQTGTPTPSYQYQATCQNDQNLIYVQGRAVKGKPLVPPRPDRHGIPEQEVGECLRCNLQIEGSGVIPEDVLIDGGDDYQNPLDPEEKPGKFLKHVVMRTDRSDGFVGRNFLLRGAAEHGFYTEETDGILLDKVKFFWHLDYGHLSFTTDHNVIQNCDGFGAGDAVVYPGASPQTGEFRRRDVYPEQRYNSVVRNCDLHGSTLAYSGSMGNSVRVTENHIYGNVAGISSDTLSAPGHPGYPADGMLIDKNYIYSNNLDLYGVEPPSIEPLVPMPIGSGIVWPGMNNGIVRDNFIFDNWRHGTVLNAVPDLVAGTPEGNVDAKVHCQITVIATTSCGNRYYDNVMGQAPKDFKMHEGVGKFGNKHSPDTTRRMPNGVDFWWDEWAANNGNCWYDNVGVDGTAASITGPGSGVLPDLLPRSCGSSMGIGDVVKAAVLLNCSMYEDGDKPADRPLCYWFQMPAKPGTRLAQQDAARQRAAADAFRGTARAKALQAKIDQVLKANDVLQGRE
ncbi:right-handed parallel beta-helix repeat-containing protein [Conexibacter sp. SYSU D00693]|uniref:right-handed parallel beta-helix repeat-containing protein n=1 Tax=Conexibacter sp. SYSU D00693 TaxID=2812560 RepID=UPI00196AB0C1|nr:right-handed parallel beta-helix repeat-containing protein [Conexibacter sp. SYSU D00693]